MSNIDSKITRISKALGVQPSTVTLVLYHYLTDCIQDVLLDGETNTLFGKMCLDDDNRLSLTQDKFGLISLLDQKDIKTIQKIAEDGPEFRIF